MKLNWIGEAPWYGRNLNFMYFTSFGVDQYFYIYGVSDDEESNHLFKVKYADEVNTMMMGHWGEVYEDIESVHLIKTDEDFRKRMKRSYNLLKFVTDSEVLTIGIYNDDGKIPTLDNSYLLCTIDFVSILAESERVTSSDQLKGTPFEEMGSLFNKSQLTKRLLKT